MKGHSRVLPLELVDEIIDYIWDNHDALKSCSLVARAWTPSTRVHMFHHIELLDFKTIRRLTRLLRFAPHVGRYVRSLRILGYVDAEGPIETLPFIASRLGAVRKLACAGSSLEVNLEKTALQFGPVKDLDISVLKCSTSTFVSLIRAYPNLTSLRVDARVSKTEPMNADMDSMPLRSLKRLWIAQPDEGSNHLLYMIFWQPMPSLEWATVKVGTTEDAHALSAFLLKGGATLKYLHMRLSHLADRDSAEAVRLADSLRCCSSLDRVHVDSAFPGWHHALVPVISSSHIKDCVVEYHLRQPHLADVLLNFVARYKFEHASMVAVRFRYEHPNTHQVNLLTNVIKNKAEKTLGELHARGVLRVKVDAFISSEDE